MTTPRKTRLNELLGPVTCFALFLGKSLCYGITIWRGNRQNVTSPINLLRCNLAHVLVWLWKFKFFLKFILFIFRLCHTARGILVPGPGIEPVFFLHWKFSVLTLLDHQGSPLKIWSKNDYVPRYTPKKSLSYMRRNRSKYFDKRLDFTSFRITNKGLPEISSG